MNGCDGDDNDVKDVDDDVDDDECDGDDGCNDGDGYGPKTNKKQMQYISFLGVYFVYQDIPLNHQYHQISNTPIVFNTISYFCPSSLVALSITLMMPAWLQAEKTTRPYKIGHTL